MDKTIFAISSGAIGISLAILDKIAPSPTFEYLYSILGLGWIFLVISLMMQTLSFIRTAKRIKSNIDKLEEIISVTTISELRVKEDEFYELWKTENDKIDRDNKRSFLFMIGGISMVLLFAFLGLLTKVNKTDQTINLILSDSLINKISVMAKEQKPQNSPKQSENVQKEQSGKFNEKARNQMDTNKESQQIRTPPVKTKPKE